ncbi:hypothetical protein [Alishewanella phage vB_AspM_Slickus01]|nr:hypothetical protein [Alishewanella phage vB_AspM_Slickus01]
MDMLYGNYRAKVIDNSGDEYKAGRIKIRVYGIHDNVKVSALPWAQYADTQMIGSLMVPDVGTDVWVFFEMGDIDQPVYFAAAPNKPDVPRSASTNYPHNRVVQTKSGITIEANDAESTYTITIGDLVLTIEENELSIVMNNKNFILNNAGITLIADNKISLTAPTLSLNGL